MVLVAVGAVVQANAKQATVAAIENRILWGGAYVGEVLRLGVAEGALRWVDDNEYLPAHPQLREVIPVRNVRTGAMLITPGDTMWLPLNKLARYMDDGAEHNVTSFANLVLEGLEEG